MANPFAITAAANSIRLDTKQQAQTSFTVYNSSGRALRGRARIVAQNPASETWITVVGDAEKDFPIAGTHQYNVDIAVPPGSAPGSYPFRLDVVGTENPDEEFSQGPTVTFEVAAQPVKKPFPIWIPIAIAVVALLLVGGVIAFLVLRGGGESTPGATPIPTPIPTVVPTVKPTAKPTLAVRPTRNVVRLVSVRFERITIHDTLDGLVGDGEFIMTFKVDGETFTWPGPNSPESIGRGESRNIDKVLQVGLPSDTPLSIQVIGFEQDEGGQNDNMGVAEVLLKPSEINSRSESIFSQPIEIHGRGGDPDCQDLENGCFTITYRVTSP